MGKHNKDAINKASIAKKSVASKHRSSPRNAKGKEKMSNKEYWVVKPENGEARWYGEKSYAESYMNSLKDTSCELKYYIIFEHALKEVNHHNFRLEIDNSKFFRQLQKMQEWITTERIILSNYY